MLISGILFFHPSPFPLYRLSTLLSRVQQRPHDGSTILQRGMCSTTRMSLISTIWREDNGRLEVWQWQPFSFCSLIQDRHSRTFAAYSEYHAGFAITVGGRGGTRQTPILELLIFLATGERPRIFRTSKNVNRASFALTPRIFLIIPLKHMRSNARPRPRKLRGSLQHVDPFTPPGLPTPACCMLLDTMRWAGVGHVCMLRVSRSKSNSMTL